MPQRASGHGSLDSRPPSDLTGSPLSIPGHPGQLGGAQHVRPDHPWGSGQGTTQVVPVVKNLLPTQETQEMRSADPSQVVPGGGRGPRQYFLPGETVHRRAQAGHSPTGSQSPEHDSKLVAHAHVGTPRPGRTSCGPPSLAPGGRLGHAVLPHFHSHLHQHAGTRPLPCFPAQMQAALTIFSPVLALRVPVPESEQPASNLSSQVSSLFHVLIPTNPSTATALNG